MNENTIIDFAEMMNGIIKKEEKRLQVGSPSFIRRDREITEMIERAKRGESIGTSEKSR